MKYVKIRAYDYDYAGLFFGEDIDTSLQRFINEINRKSSKEVTPYDLEKLKRTIKYALNTAAKDISYRVEKKSGKKKKYPSKFFTNQI